MTPQTASPPPPSKGPSAPLATTAPKEVPLLTADPMTEAKAPSGKGAASKAELDNPPWPPEGAPPEFAIYYPDGWTIAYEQRHRSLYYDQMGEKDTIKALDERDDKGLPFYGVAAPAANKAPPAAKK